MPVWSITSSWKVVWPKEDQSKSILFFKKIALVARISAGTDQLVPRIKIARS